MILTDPPHVSSSSDAQTRISRSTSPTLSASQVISRIVLSNIGVRVSTERSLIPYLSGTSTTTMNLTSSNHTSSVEPLCSICLQSLDQEQGELYKLKVCSHVFHKRCVSQWKKYSTKCPCCRGPISDDLGLTLSRLRSLPVEEVMPEMTRAAILENIIFGLVGCVWPICLVSVFLVFEVPAFGIFIVLTFFMAISVILQEESRTVSRLCLLLFLCVVFPPAIVILVISFVLQVFYVFYRTAKFHGNVFMCRLRWSSANKFIINRTMSLITYLFDWLNEM